MKKLPFLFLLGSLLMSALSSTRAQQPGGLDPSFAPAKIDLGVQQIIAQAGGSALVAGRYTTINGTAVGPVVRLKADGTLDPDFVNTNLDYIPAGDTQVNSIAIASGSDGKIYVALNTTPSLTATLVRLNANGSTDTSFHTTVDGAPNAMVVQPNGQVVIAGSFSTLNGVSVNGCLARLEPDGSTDSSFDTSPRPGAQAIQFTFAYELAVQADGKFLVGGIPSYNNNSSVIARLNADGSLDSSFFINSVDGGSLDAFTLQPDGNLVIGYNVTALSGATAPYTVRLLTHSTDGTDGQVDPSFQPSSSVTGFPYNIVAQADGKLVYSVGASIFRLNADGSADRTFTLGAPSNSTDVVAYAQSTDGNLLVAGQVLINGDYAPGIARLFGNVPGGATTVSVVVPGNANIWLARDGSTDLADLVPIQQPVRVVDLALTAGSTLSFANVTGLVSYGGGQPTDGPDGIAGSPENHAAENGISGVNAPLDGLVGVFIDETAAGNVANPPATLDFSGVIGLDFASLQPALGQVFFIGNGQTSGGVTQQFTVPAGATHLVLGTVDGLGWYNNTGAFAVTINASAGGGAGGSNGLVVPGTANPWLARDGSTDPNDTLATAGPVRVPDLTLTPGATLSFSATGLVSIYGNTPAYALPDGDAGSTATHPAENGVSGVTVDYNSLVGVFIDDTPAGSATAPADLDFVNSGGVPGGFDYPTLTPALGQMFFIGDGKTSGGATQQVTVPAGATHLVLGVTDTDAYNDNAGAFTVTITSSGNGGGGGGGTGGGSLVVPGTANPWLAGQENGIFASKGADQAPAQSPVQVPNLTLDPNKGLVFSVGGTVNLGGGSTTQYSPDGNFFVTHAAENGITGTKTHQGALIGVFLNDNTPSAASVPGDLDYSIGAGVSASSYSPRLQQAFFIGDGADTLTRTQTFYPPAGATRLFLGVMDNTAFSDNTGSFSVGVSTSSIDPSDLSVAENVTSSSIPGGNGSFALVGDVLTYTFTVRNSGQTAFTNAYVHDVLPSYIDLSKTVISDGGSVDSSVVAWSLGTLAPGAVIARTLQVTLANNAPLGIHLTNPGYSATADGLPDVSGHDLPDTLIESAVSVKITNNTATGKPGGVVKFVYDLTNTTPEAFKKLTLTVPFLPGLSYHAVYFTDANGNQLPVDTKGKKVAAYNQQSNSAVFTLNSLASGGEMFLVVEATVAYNFNPVGLVSLPGAQITISKYTNGQPITLALDDSSSALSGQPADAPPKLVFGKSVVTGNVAAILLAANPNTAALLNATTLKPFLDLNPNQKAVAKLGNFTTLAALTADQITQVFNPFVGSDTDPDTNAAVSTVPEPTTGTPNPFVTFGLAFSNTGSGKATSVTVFDSAPKGLVIDRDSFFVNGVATPQSAIQFNDDGSYAITTKNLKPGKGGLIFYRAQVLAPADPPNGVQLGGYIVPTSAQLTIENLDDEVVAPAPDHLLLTGPAHASVSSTQTGDTTTGSNVTYTILYKNDGGQTIQDFRVVSPVPPGGAFQSAQFLGIDQQHRDPNGTKGEFLVTPGAGATSGLTVFHLGKVKTRGLGLVQVVYQMTSAVLQQPNQALVHQPYVAATGGLPTANGLSTHAPVRRQLSGLVTRDVGDTSVGAAAAPNTSRPTNNPNGPHLGMTVAFSQTVNTGETLGFTFTVVSLGHTGVFTQAPLLPNDASITFNVPVPDGTEYAGIVGSEPDIYPVSAQVKTGANGKQYVTGLFPPLFDDNETFVTVSFRAQGASRSTINIPDMYLKDALSGTELHSGPVVATVTTPTDFANDQRLVALNTLNAVSTTTFTGAGFQQRVDQISSKSRFTAVINADYLSLENGVLIIPTADGKIVAQGGGNIVAQGGGNIVAQGGGNIVAQGGGNIVAQGGGNIVAQGGGNLISVKNIVDGSGKIISQDGSTIANLFAGIVAQGGGNIVAQGGGNIVAQGGGNLQSVGVKVVSNDGGSFAASADKALAISQADLASFGQATSLSGEVFRSESGNTTLMTSGFAAAVAGGAIKVDGLVKGTSDNLSLSNVTSQGNIIRGGNGIVAQGGGN